MFAASGTTIIEGAALGRALACCRCEPIEVVELPEVF